MSDHDTFMTLPSLVRQALENTAGVDGAEVEANPYEEITISKCDWLIIRNYLIDLKECADETEADFKKLLSEHY